MATGEEDRCFEVPAGRSGGTSERTSARVRTRFDNMELGTANYLHYGNALECRDLLAWGELHGLRSKRELLNQIGSDGGRAAALGELIRAFGPRRCRRMDVDRFREGLADSLRMRAWFKALGCRGFSYELHRFARIWGPRTGVPLPLRRAITLRFALMPGERLFYPPKIRRYLGRARRSHCFRRGLPVIAFGLGAEVGRAWYLFVLQSDLAFRTPAYIREHFRGWRRVLFAHILGKARGRVDAVYLCTAEDALRACHRDYYAPRTLPESWQVIYGRTAADFGMPLRHLNRRVNIQVFSRQRPVWTSRFHEFRMTRDIRAPVWDPFESGARLSTT
jgi:hypothetical protein